MYDAFTTLSIAIKAALMEGYNLQYQIEAMKSREQKVKCHEPPISVLEIGPQITKYIKKVADILLTTITLRIATSLS